MARPVRYDRLPTEQPNPASRDLDRRDPLAVIRLMHREDRRAVTAVGRVLAEVAALADLIAAALGAGGRLLFVGAGTSGRLGVLEAAECPPTFGTPPALVQALVAGGRPSVFRSREGAEDDRAAASREVRARVRRGDLVVGVSASGVTPFVLAALAAARRRGAITALVTCNPEVRLPRGLARVVIALDTGPEVVAGSTRLKAGTATKLVLNMLTTAAMVRLGRVAGHRMVDLRPRSRKLEARAARMIAELSGLGPAAAHRALAAAGGSVRAALAAARERTRERRGGRPLIR